jgi:hypothetical protein
VQTARVRWHQTRTPVAPNQEWAEPNAAADKTETLIGSSNSSNGSRSTEDNAGCPGRRGGVRYRETICDRLVWRGVIIPSPRYIGKAHTAPAATSGSLPDTLIAPPDQFDPTGPVRRRRTIPLRPQLPLGIWDQRFAMALVHHVSIWRARCSARAEAGRGGWPVAGIAQPSLPAMGYSTNFVPLSRSAPSDEPLLQRDQPYRAVGYQRVSTVRGRSAVLLLHSRQGRGGRPSARRREVGFGGSRLYGSVVWDRIRWLTEKEPDISSNDQKRSRGTQRYGEPA